MTEILDQEYWNNTLREYLYVALILLLGIVVLKFLKRTLLKQIQRITDKTQNHLDDHILESVEKYLFPVFYFTIIYFGLRSLEWEPKVVTIFSAAYTVILTFYAVSLIAHFIRLSLRSYAGRRGHGPEAVKQIGGIILIVNVLVWGLGLLFLFDNLGYDVTAVVAGLGVGGIAIALAAQNILGDLFNYFVIFFDRPFEIGDFLIIGDNNGVVDKIGIKTTRIKTLSGEQLVVSNSDLTSSRIRNYKKMERRRVVFSIGVVYETPLDLLKKIPEVLKEIILLQEQATFDRSHFQNYGDFSLNFETVYYVESPDYTLYMDIQQQINFKIYERFQELGLVIAFPTRTLYLRNQDDQNFQVNLQDSSGASSKDSVTRDV